MRHLRQENLRPRHDVRPQPRRAHSANATPSRVAATAGSMEGEQERGPQTNTLR